MRLPNWLVILVCLILACGLLIGASLQIDRIHTMRSEMGLVANEPLENAPPSLAFATVAMGAFRGLVVDILWIRADKLKEEGLFFDAKQLAEWITVLQPRFATVWDFQAWNMAYNISVAMPNTQCDQRWHWVRSGYELLRDKGIPLNPNSILLYRSMAWIFQHKIGGITDDCHRYYKRELALQMRQIMGVDPDPAVFERLVQAPETWEQLRADPAVAQILDEIIALDSRFEGAKGLSDYYLMLRAQPQDFEAAAAVVEKNLQTPAMQKIDSFCRAYKLTNTWKLKPERMQKINQRYGPFRSDDPNERLPLNWEHPQTHAIYWAELGLQRAGNDGDFSANEKNTDRIVAHGLQKLRDGGRIVLYRNAEGKPSLFQLPDLRMFEPCDQVWRERIRKYEQMEGGRPTGMLSGHKNFLQKSVLAFYQNGQVKKAEQIYDTLRREYPREEYKVPLFTFVQNRLKEDLQGVTISDAARWIILSLRDALFRYALYDDEASFARERWAKEIYDMYLAEYHDGLEEADRLFLPSFEQLRFQAMQFFMEDPTFPENMKKNLVHRIKLERPELLEKIRKRIEELETQRLESSPQTN